MPGSLCHGEPTDGQVLRQSKAYCEGRSAAVAGTLKANNPFTAGTVEATRWDAGHDSYNGGVGTPFRDCCADLGYT